MKRLTICLCAILVAANSGWANGGFGDIFSDGRDETGQDALAGVQVSGEIGIGLRFFLDEGWESQVVVSPAALLRMDAVSGALEGTVAFDLEVHDDPGALVDVIDELYLRAFFDFGYLTAGFFKTEWGKGDGTHVIDPLNPIVQEEGIDTDLLRMKRAEAMVMGSVYLGENGLLELVYKPLFHPQQAALEGRWATGAPDLPSPDTGTLKHSQGAARLTGTIGPFDLGAMYYYGFIPEPGYDIETVFTGQNPLDPADYETSITMVLTRAHLAGLEGATAVGPFTFRTELGYWITEDDTGDQPELYNDRFVYLGGLDLMVPGTSLFFSVQVTGAYIFNFPEASDTDVDRMAFKTNHDTTVIGAIDIPFARETMNLRLNGLYHIERGGYLIIPEYRWSVVDDLELLVSGQILGGSSSGGSLYHAWDGNDNIGVTLIYTF